MISEVVRMINVDDLVVDRDLARAFSRSVDGSWQRTTLSKIEVDLAMEVRSMDVPGTAYLYVRAHDGNADAAGWLCRQVGFGWPWRVIPPLREAVLVSALAFAVTAYELEAEHRRLDNIEMQKRIDELEAKP